MLKLARWCTTHRMHVVLAWIALIVLVGAASEMAGPSYSDNFSLPGSGAQRAGDLLERSFPSQAGDRDQIVLHTMRTTVENPAVEARVDAMLAKVARLDHVAAVVSPYAPGSSGRAISADRHTAFATVVFNQDASDLSGRAVKRVIAVAKAAATPRIEVALGGKAVEGAEQSEFGLATAIGLMAAIVVLLLTFGSLIAMGLPIVTALFGLGSGVALIVLFTHFFEMPSFSSELAAMVGLGVGIDYALFIVTRFREAYATPGRTFGNVRESVVQAMNTAGRAVLFAGATVVIALLGMLLLDVELLNGAAIASAIGVLMVMLGSVTLLPALMTFAGSRLARAGWSCRHFERSRARVAAHRAGSAELRRDADYGASPHAHHGLWARWSAFVQRRPLVIAAFAVFVLVLAAAPISAMRLGSSDAGNNPQGSSSHRAYELLAHGFGQGFNGPLLVVAKAPPAHTLTAGNGARPGDPGPAGLAGLRAALAATPDVASVSPVHLNTGAEVATVSVYPRSAPQDNATTQLVNRLRQGVIPPFAARSGIRVYVGGVTAGAIDFAATLSQKLPLFIGVVVAVSALLLLLVFRSLVIPVQAAIMNLLSIGAALGVVVAIFQWGWLDSLAGIPKGPIESFIPVMLFAIVFGLSMDYEVFVISRIHEQWRRTGSPQRAVREGLATTGRVITAAAAIMICVFLSFFLGEERIIEEFGLSLATAVFVDAVVVRCLLLPALLSVLGALTWRLPGWLDAVLPHINVDGVPAAVPAARERSAPGIRFPEPGVAGVAGAVGGLARAGSHAAAVKAVRALGPGAKVATDARAD
jgi:RND superfamily putative drug exporter